MKILCSIVAVLLTLTISAQANQQNSEKYLIVSPATDKDNLLFSWDAGADLDATYFIQASKDGKNFKTIGIIWGTTSEMDNICMFKEKRDKINKFRTYRVCLESSSPVVSK